MNDIDKIYFIGFLVSRGTVTDFYYLWINKFYYMGIIQLLENNGFVIHESGYIIGRKSKKRMIGGADKKGYIRISISIGNEQLTVKEHRIIAMKYVPNPLNKPQVNHKNGIKNDNRPCNLEWVTNKENSDHAIKNGLKYVSVATRTAQKAACSKLVIDTQYGIFYSSAEEAGRLLGISRSTLRGRLNGHKINNTSLIYC